MKLSKAFSCILGSLLSITFFWSDAQTVLRYNQLGYTPENIKVVVAASKDAGFVLKNYQVKNQKTGKVVLQVSKPVENDFGAYGPFKHSYRISISTIRQPGAYRLILNDSISSGIIRIDDKIYKGKADQCLQFLRNQRCGFNPFLMDVCHPQKDYSMGGPVPDSTLMDVSGGWHNAGNYSQEIGSAALTTWYLLSAYNNFPGLFNDGFKTSGIAGKNDYPDILDEAKWGLNWLMKMHPAKDIMYWKVDATGITGSLTKRPVYYASRTSKVTNNTQTAESAGLLSSAFSLGAIVFKKEDLNYANRLAERGVNAYDWAFAGSKNRMTSHYWSNLNTLMLAASQLYALKNSAEYSDDLNEFLFIKQDNDQWTAKANAGMLRLCNYEGAGNCVQQKQVIETVYKIAKDNAFMHGIPFISGSNSLTVAFVNQCNNYRLNCADTGFAALEQANIDWLFGSNPWGITMVAGFPSTTAAANPYGIHTTSGLKNGLVTGPVSPEIYKTSAGNSLLKKDALAAWQSPLAVYHDDRADYITNEPTVEGTAALIYLLACRENESIGKASGDIETVDGAIVRGDSGTKKIAIVFTGDQYNAGAKTISQVLSKEKVKASFFVSGRFVKSNASFVRQLKSGGNYIGPNGAGSAALQENYEALMPLGISQKTAPVFLPNTPFYHEALSGWAQDPGLLLLTPTPGTLSVKDNSLPGSPGYTSSDDIFQSIMKKAYQRPYGLNGYFLVFHLDADAKRTDHFYMLLPLLIQSLKNEGYQFVRADEMAGLKAPVYKAIKPAGKKPAAKKKTKKR